MVGGAPGGGRDVTEAEFPRLRHQLLPQIEVPGSLPFGRCSAALHHLRTYFIAVATYANTAMHYDISFTASGLGLETLDAARKNPLRGAPPARVK